MFEAIIISSISYGFKLNLIALRLVQEESLGDLLWLFHAVPFILKQEIDSIEVS
jgi:hypothetical protein